jgi:hypothetical protein
MTDCSEDELIQYFKLLYKSCDDYAILYDKSMKKKHAEPEKMPEKTTKVQVDTGSWNVIHL